MDFLTNILANLFDKFKSKSPKVAGLIILILTMLIAGLETQYAQELLGESAQRISQVVLFVWVALQGTHTSEILKEQKKQDSAKK